LPLAKNSLSLRQLVVTFVLALNNFARSVDFAGEGLPGGESGCVSRRIWMSRVPDLDVCALVIAPLLLLAWMSRREFSWPAGSRGPGPAAALVRRQLARPLVFRFVARHRFAGLLFRVGCDLCSQIRMGSNATWTELAWRSGQRAKVQFGILLSLPQRPRSWSPRSLYCSAIEMRSPSASPSSIPNGIVSSKPRRLRGTSYRWEQVLYSEIPSGFFGFRFFSQGVLCGPFCLIAVLNRSFLAPFYQSVGVVILAFLIRYFGSVGWRTASRRRCRPSISDLIADASLEWRFSAGR